MQFTFSTPLGEDDRAVLAAILGVPPAAEAAKPVKADKPAKAPKAEKQPAPEDAAAANGEVTLAEAVAAATKLVSTGEAARVKEALAAVGVKRVSELTKQEDIAAFLANLNG